MKYLAFLLSVSTLANYNLAAPAETEQHHDRSKVATSFFAKFSNISDSATHFNPEVASSVSSSQPVLSEKPVTTNDYEVPKKPTDCIGVKRYVRNARQSNRYLAIEVIADDVIHLETSTKKKSPATDRPLFVSQMIDTSEYEKYFCGPSVVNERGDVIETANLKLTINMDSLETQVFDKINNKFLTRFSYSDVYDKSRLSWTREETKAVYGIAAAFGADANPQGQEGIIGQSNGNFLGKKYDPQSAPYKGDNNPRFGNVMGGFDKGAAIFAQFPIMYALGDNGYQWAFFFDNIYGQNWDLADPNGRLQVTAGGLTHSLFIIQGNSLKALRKRYMRLVGPSKVPNKEYFGLQHSIYGFRNFEEMFRHINITRAAKIPIDGMVLDLYWFGGQNAKWANGQPENTRFGELSWDLDAFPNPTANIGRLRKDYGVGVTLIEEPFIGMRTAMYKKLEQSFALTQAYKFGPPDTLNYNNWWGRGGTIDWTAPNSTLWHDCNRCALITDCKVDEKQCSGLPQKNFAADITGHWIDLGEPEIYNDGQTYWGWVDSDGSWKSDHASVHNVFQLLSSKAMYDGYQKKNLRRRANSLVRTGTSGIHRYGSALWSADISAYLPVLGNHYGAHKHIAMGGIDFFGSDIGGFHRKGITQRPWLKQRGVTMDSSYSLWLANSAFTDVPLRVHADQTNCFENGQCGFDPNINTNPAQVGDVASNTFNIRSRYELFPYYYSLAHHANLYLEPVFLPLFLAYEKDHNVRSMGDQMMVGPSLLVATSTQYFQDSKSVYLPAGEWYDIRSFETFRSKGQTFQRSLLYTPPKGDKQVRVVPVFVKGGSIIPRTFVDEQTMNNAGRRLDGSTFKAQLVRIFPVLTSESNVTATFQLVEDDGETSAYMNGDRAITNVHMVQEDSSITVTFEPTEGTYLGAPDRRPYIVEIVVAGRQLRSSKNNDTKSTENAYTVSVNGQTVEPVKLDKFDYLSPQEGYALTENNQVLVVSSSVLSVNEPKKFKIDL